MQLLWGWQKVCVLGTSKLQALPAFVGCSTCGNRDSIQADWKEASSWSNGSSLGTGMGTGMVRVAPHCPTWGDLWGFLGGRALFCSGAACHVQRHAGVNPANMRGGEAGAAGSAPAQTNADTSPGSPLGTV